MASIALIFDNQFLQHFQVIEVENQKPGSRTARWDE
jgi:hypothetical protein